MEDAKEIHGNNMQQNQKKYKEVVEINDSGGLGGLEANSTLPVARHRNLDHGSEIVECSGSEFMAAACPQKRATGPLPTGAWKLWPADTGAM